MCKINKINWLGVSNSHPKLKAGEGRRNKWQFHCSKTHGISLGSSFILSFCSFKFDRQLSNEVTLGQRRRKVSLESENSEAKWTKTKKRGPHLHICLVCVCLSSKVISHAKSIWWNGKCHDQPVTRTSVKKLRERNWKVTHMNKNCGETVMDRARIGLLNWISLVTVHFEFGTNVKKIRERREEWKWKPPKGTLSLSLSLFNINFCNVQVSQEHFRRVQVPPKTFSLFPAPWYKWFGHRGKMNRNKWNITGQKWRENNFYFTHLKVHFTSGAGNLVKLTYDT